MIQPSQLTKLISDDLFLTAFEEVRILFNNRLELIQSVLLLGINARCSCQSWIVQIKALYNLSNQLGIESTPDRVECISPAATPIYIFDFLRRRFAKSKTLKFARCFRESSSQIFPNRIRAIELIAPVCKLRCFWLEDTVNCTYRGNTQFKKWRSGCFIRSLRKLSQIPLNGWSQC